MKVSFTKEDNIYKIFKTLKKIPSHKQVDIFISPENSFFEHTRRGLQLKDLIKQLQLKAKCLAVTKEQKDYYEHIQLPYLFRPEQKADRFSSIKNIFFSTKSIHEKLLIKKNFISYLIILSELSVILLVMYIFRGMISPNATIHVKPAYQLEEIVYNYYMYPDGTAPNKVPQSSLSLPYHQASLPYSHEMTVDVDNISLSLLQAEGRVSFYNTQETAISLIGNSTLITDDGLEYTTNLPVNIPAGTPENPGIAVADVTAKEYQENGLAIGERGNIPKDTTLWIKNLPESREQKSIYAVSEGAFKGGETIMEGTVLIEDIERIEEIMISYMEDNKNLYLKEQFKKKDSVILPFLDTITLTIDQFTTTSSEGDNATFVEGKIDATITYYYVHRADILAAIDRYLQQRPSINSKLYDYDTSSLTFYEKRDTEFTGHYIIPTKLNVVRGYDFNEDRSGIVQEITERIVGLPTSEARDEILQYDEILDASISLSPPWYDTLPQTPSRISFDSTMK